MRQDAEQDEDAHSNVRRCYPVEEVCVELEQRLVDHGEQQHIAVFPISREVLDIEPLVRGQRDRAQHKKSRHQQRGH